MVGGRAAGRGSTTPFGRRSRASTRLAYPLALAAATLVLVAPAADAAGPPQIGATWVTEVAASSANLHATVNPEGLSSTYRFEYIAAADFQANLEAQPPREGFAGAQRVPTGAAAGLGSASVDQPALQHLEGLKAGTAYRYRIAATNAEGKAAGPANTLISEESSLIFTLPDGRGWEIVSPLQKNGDQVQGAGQSSGGGVLQAAANGEAVTYSSAASFGEGAQGTPSASQYISHREAGGWATEDISIPLFSGSYGDSPNGVPYQLFSSDLAGGLVSNGERCRGEGEECPLVNPPLAGSGAPAGYRNYYLRDDTNSGFQALLSEANSGELTLAPQSFELGFAAATPDLHHVVLSTCAKLTAEATEVPAPGGCDLAEENLYEWSEGALRLINLLPGEIHGTPGAQIAARARAISADGNRVYFTEAKDGHLYLREGGQSKLITELGSFQTASADGSIAFFTNAGHLYRYSVAGEVSTDLTPAGEVLGVLGASEDGSYVYYATAAGVFLWHSAATVPVAAAAQADSYPPATGSARVSPDGTRLAFLSMAGLTGYDNTDQSTGKPDSEAYLYDADTAALTCASCNPTGERPLGPSTISGAIANGQGSKATDSYKPRNLAVGRLFFDSADSLAPQDTNNRPDVYEWEARGVGNCQKAAGCLALISSGRSSEGASFLDASVDGSDAFFLTDGSLVPQDPGSVDLYDARVGGGFALPAVPAECDGDTCQSIPSPPEDPTPGTLVSGPPNPPVHFPKSRHRKKSQHKNHRHRKVARQNAGRG